MKKPKQQPARPAPSRGQAMAAALAKPKPIVKKGTRR